MMAKIKSWFNCDLQHAVQVQALNGNVFSMDNNGNQICVRIFDGGEKAVISATVTARCILADGSTVNLNGSLTSVNSQSVAVVDIPQSVLLIPGTLKISVQLTASSVVATIAAIITTVYATKTDNVITPSSQVISDWNAEISAQLASALKFTSQSLTDSEKATARSNISAASASELQAEATARATADTTLQGNIDAEAATRAAADADLKSAFDSVTGKTKNLWIYGDQSFTKSKLINDINLPAGTYVVSAEITNSASGTNKKARCSFYKTSVTNENLLDTHLIVVDGTRQSNIFTLAEKADIVTLNSASNDSASKDITAIWANIQLETGSTVSKYVPVFTAKDFELRNEVEEVEDDLTSLGNKVDNREKQTRNLWTLGDQEFTNNSGYLEFPLDAGTYTISALVHSYKTGAEPNGQTVRIELSNSSKTLLTNFGLAREARTASTFTLESASKYIRLFAANNSTYSADVTSVWKNIQVEKSSRPTNYINPKVIGDIENTIPKYDDVVLEINDFTTAKSSYVFTTKRKYADQRNLIIDCTAKWTGNESDEYHVPEMRMYYSTADQGSCYYNIGSKDIFTSQKMRMPPFPDYTNEHKDMFRLAIYVPEGITLTIKKLVVRYDDSISREETGFRLDTHGAFMFYPQHSIWALKAAQRCGATRFVTIPKRSSDGVWFAYHDDKFIESTTLLRNSDGTQISSSGYDDSYFRDIPWEGFLDSLDSGVSTNSIYAGTKLMKIETMLEICNKAGIKPVFSCHPYYTTAETQSLKSMLKEYGLLKYTTLLPADYWFTEQAFPVFGNDIEMYKFGIGQDGTTQDLEDLITLINNTSDLDKSKVCIALWINNATEERIGMIKNAGYRIAMHEITHTTVSGITSPYFSEGDLKYYQKMGVTVFTENHNPSTGLDF